MTFKTVSIVLKRDVTVPPKPEHYFSVSRLLSKSMRAQTRTDFSEEVTVIKGQNRFEFMLGFVSTYSDSALDFPRLFHQHRDELFSSLDGECSFIKLKQSLRKLESIVTLAEINFRFDVMKKYSIEYLGSKAFVKDDSNGVMREVGEDLFCRLTGCELKAFFPNQLAFVLTDEGRKYLNLSGAIRHSYLKGLGSDDVGRVSKFLESSNTGDSIERLCKKLILHEYRSEKETHLAFNKVHKKLKSDLALMRSSLSK